ncbi:MAG: cytochrome c [Novosphingobium sp.]|jgi:cytochrome c556|nr:cytochrome c [Novosphingobium sp.]
MKAYIMLAPLACLALTACGGPRTPGEKAAHERHENFEAIGDTFKGLGDALKRDKPDIAKIRQDAAKINDLAPRVKTWFPAGSGPQDGVRTKALQAVWSDPDAFGQAAAKFVDAASALNAAAESGDLAAVRGAVPPLGATCKGCHQRFKKKD